MKKIFYAIALISLAACAKTRTKPPASSLKPRAAVEKGAASVAAQAYDQDCKNALEAARQAIAAMEAYKGAKNTVTVLQPLNELYMGMDKAASTAGLYRNVHPDSEVRGVADRCEQELQKLWTGIGLSRPIYEAVKAVDVAHEDAKTRYWVKLMLRDFKRAGVDKDEQTRGKIKALREELVKITQDFAKNMREDVRTIKLDSAAELGGLPQDYVEAHKAGADGKITLTTDYPDIVPFMTYAKSDTRRREFYTAFRERAYPQNEQVLNKLLQKRYELARILGYKNWAEYATEDKMIKSPEAAHAFIDKISELAKARAQKDYDELLKRLQREDAKAKEVADWQKAYVEESVKKDNYKIDSQLVRAYFPYDKVKQGIMGITSRMFGVEYVKIDVPVWHVDVEAYELKQKGNVIGRFYLDMHPRADKYKHAAEFPMQAGIAGKRLPEAALVCNFPSGDALMEHDDVETFFHEFGHLLHHLFAGDQRWVAQSGITTEGDFVEAPSQMLEEWAWDATTLKTFAQNKKGETIPDVLIQKMQKARDFGKGLWTRHQMFYAAVSLNYYDRDPTAIDTTALLKEMQAKYSLFKYVDGTHFQMSFGHLDEYSAVYYTYMWSLVIARDLLGLFQKEGLTNPTVADRYRQNVLAPGGSDEAAALVKNFLGRDYTFDAYARWLNGK